MDITIVLSLLVKHNLTGSSDKTTIAVIEAVCPGHVVGNEQRKPIAGKVAASIGRRPRQCARYEHIWGSATSTRGISRCMPSTQPP